MRKLETDIILPYRSAIFANMQGQYHSLTGYLCKYGWLYVSEWLAIMSLVGQYVSDWLYPVHGFAAVLENQ